MIMEKRYTPLKRKLLNRFRATNTAFGRSLLKMGIVLLFVLNFSQVQAQITMPDMVVPSDTWGLIDVNKLYGGCMQVNTHAELLATDVQYLKRGMLIIVYDDDNVTAGLQTRMYMFLPAEGTWNYTTPFQIPAVDQNKTITTSSLESALVPLNLGTNPDPVNKNGVYYDTTAQTFLWYNNATSAWEDITPALTAEVTRATAAEGTLTTNLGLETTRATDAEATKEDLVNKSTDVATDASSDIKYPSVKSV